MASVDVVTLVEELVTNIIENTPLELVDVEFVKERDWYLRVFLDKEGGIEVDDCQWVSEQLSKALDARNPIPQNYYLEVSSPGLDRPLKKPRDFQRNLGQEVEVSTYGPVQGKKQFVGTLVRADDTEVVLSREGKELSVPRDKIAQVKLHVTI